MRLCTIEKAVMSSSVRGAMMNWVEAPMLFKDIAKGQFANMLELGCGAGFGTDNILRRLSPDTLISTDYDEGMLETARRLVGKKHPSANVDFQQADATQLGFPGNSFDAVVAIGILHHIHKFHKAIEEIYRVLKPGGKFFIEEVLKEAHFWPINKLMVPAILFKDSQILEALQDVGFDVQWRGRYLKAFILLECTKKVA